MPLTIGEIIAGGSLGAAFLSIGNWIRSTANRGKDSADRLDGRLTILESTSVKKSCQEKLDKRLKTLEDIIAEKSSLIDIHGVNLTTGEKQMKEIKSQLETMNISMNGIHLLLKDVSGDIKGLGAKITSGTKEVFMQLDPRIKRIAEKVKDLEDDKDKKSTTAR